MHGMENTKFSIFQTARTASTTYVKTAYRPRLRVYVEKVKVTLKKAIKTQRVSRGVTLLFL
jgi:hypothetical protein